jgi:hypothetical protein
MEDIVGETLARQHQRLVPRYKIRDLTYRVRAAGLSAGEVLFLEQEESGLALLALLAFCEKMHIDSLDDDQRTAQLFALFYEFLHLVSYKMPVILNCDLPDGRPIVIDRLDEGWCWNAFRFRKAGLHEVFVRSR